MDQGYRELSLKSMRYFSRSYASVQSDDAALTSLRGTTYAITVRSEAPKPVRMPLRAVLS